MAKIKTLVAKDHADARDLAFGVLDAHGKDKKFLPDDQDELKRQVVLMAQEIDYLRNVCVNLTSGIGKGRIPAPQPLKVPDPLDPRTQALDDDFKAGRKKPGQV